jgi:hypothetical protein
MSGAIYIYRGRERQVSDSVSSVEKQGEAKARAVEVPSHAALREGPGAEGGEGSGGRCYTGPVHEERGGG